MRIFETLPKDISYLERAVDVAPARVTPDTLLVDALALMSSAPSCALLSEQPPSNSGSVSAAPSSYVLVMEGSQVVGLFTERDVVRLTASGMNLAGVKIADVMSKPPITLTQSEFQGIFTVLSLFRQHQIRHLPLVDDRGELIGVITPESICQVLPNVNFLKSLSVGEVMNTQVISASATADTLSLACLMAEKQVSCVVIVDTDNRNNGDRPHPVGIVTEGDILQFQALGLNLSQTRAEAVMSSPLFFLSESDSLWTAYQEMQRRHVGRLVVCGSQGEVLGTVAERSIVHAIAPRQMYQAIGQLQRQVQRLEAEKIEMLQNRNAQLEQLVQERTAQLQEQASCDRLLADMAQSIRQSINLEEILNATVSQVRQFLQTDRVIIYRLKPDGSGVVVVESVDDGWVSMLGKHIQDDRFIETYAQLYKQGRIQAVEDIYTAGLNQCHVDLLAQYQVRANLVVPILQGEQLWGLLVANDCASPREWRQLEIDWVSRLSTQVAIAIQQASLFEQAQTELASRVQAENAIRRLNAELEQRITERTQELLNANAQLEAEMAKRKIAEESRQKEQEFLKAVLDNVEAGIVACDAKGNLTIFNQTLRRFHNLPHQKLPAYQWTQYYNLYMPDGKTPMSKKDVPLFQALQGERVENVEMAIVPKKGLARTLLASGQAIYGRQGEKLGAVVVMHDITARKLADERLAKINKCFLSFGTDPNENINRLTALCGEVLQANYAFYDRLDGELLCGVAQWNAPPDYNRADNPDKQICGDVIKNGTDFTLVQNLPQSNLTDANANRYRWQTYVAYPVKCSGINVGCLCAVYKNDFVPSADDKKIIGIVASAIGVEEERKQADAALRQSKERFRNLVEHTNDLVWEVDNNFIFTYVNPHIDKLLGYSPAEVLGKTLFDFMSEDEAQRLTTIFEYLTPQKEPFNHLEKTLVHKDGHSIVFESSGLPLFTAEGVLEGYRGIDRDITERKRLELEMRKALATQKELAELRAGFVTMASHEFRTPLTTILAAAESIEHYRYKWAEEKKIAYLQRIQNSVKHMIAMLNDVLILGKVEARKIEVNPEPLDLENFSRELVDEVQLSNVEYRIDFAIQGECGTACVDEKLLRHILSNLLSNAIKYSPKGSKVYFAVACQNGVGEFKIRDEGIGIPLEDQKRLFEPFHRCKNVGKIPGNGLGLAIVKKSVELHGGKLAFASEVGKGTTFTVTMPLNKGGK